MVDYNKLFDVLYSDTIPMTVKESIVENVKEQISEDIFEAEENPYINILNNLVYSEMSESTTNELIDKIFGNLSENEIEAITNKFIKESCVRVVSSGEIPIMEGSTDYIGLARMRADDRKSRIHGIDRTKKSPLDKLKGVVDKVKTAAKNSLPGYIMQDRPTGLSQIKGLDRIKANKPNTAEAPKAETKQEAPKAEAKYWRGQDKGVPDPDKPIHVGTSKKETGTSVVPVKSGVPATAKASTEAPKAETKQEGTKALTAQPVHLLPDLQKGKKATRKEKVEQLKLNVGAKDKEVEQSQQASTKKKRAARVASVKNKVKEQAEQPQEQKEEVKTAEEQPSTVKASTENSRGKGKDVQQAIKHAEDTTGKTVTPKGRGASMTDADFQAMVAKHSKRMGVSLPNNQTDKKTEETAKVESGAPESKKEGTPKTEIKVQKPKAEETPKVESKSQEVKAENETPKTENTENPQGKKRGRPANNGKTPYRINLRKSLERVSAKQGNENTQETNSEENKVESSPEVETGKKQQKKDTSETQKPEESMSNKIEAADQRVQADAETSQKKENSDEDREAKLARIRYKRHLKDEASGITKAIESLQSQLSALKSKPGSSESDIQSLEQRIKDAESKKADTEKLLAAYESYSNSILSSLLTSAISESTMEEIVEMVCSKALAQRAAEREHKQANDSMNNLNKVIEVEAETGKSPVTPEVKQKLVDKANKDAEKYESVKASVERKYGK